MSGGWFWGGGGNDFDYEKYAEERRKRVEEERKAARAEQDAIDAIPDPEARTVANRKRYRCGPDRFVAPADIASWRDVAPKLAANPKHTTAGSGGGMRGGMMFGQDEVSFRPEDMMRQKPINDELNGKVCIWQGDITRLEVDGIVNAANSSLLGGGGIDGAIHGAAGDLLLAECETLNGAETGETKITKGYRLPAKHVLHTVGPIGGGDDALKSCYTACMDLVEQHNLRTIAFCCVSTGIFGFPLVRATHIALNVIRSWLETGDNRNKVDRIIFCVFRDIEVEAYEKILPSYFPIDGYPEKELPEGVSVLPPEPPRTERYGGMGGMGGGMGGMGGGGMGGRGVRFTGQGSAGPSTY